MIKLALYVCLLMVFAIPISHYLRNEPIDWFCFIWGLFWVSIGIYFEGK